ncbi:MAG: type 1 glutamine amidotransferase [Nitrospirae bacterium]|jgi:GMP synthase (glutamine-hydrolysing)|nr:type 1 glutamine amidotransferase [Nitrospirota bacterium]
MAVLIIKNIETEGPGTIEDYLRREDVSFSIIELGSGETPPSLEEFDTLVILGGPMGVYEMDEYPHLMAESRLIREAINRELKVLGICLGSQMIAYCLGAEIYPAPKKETGWYHIELTGEGLKDPLMRQLAIHPGVGDFWRRFKVFHWHGDTFDLPSGAFLLASSILYKNQAFRYGNKVYGFQFHLEATTDMILYWSKGLPDIDKMSKETEKIYEEYSGRALRFYKAFFGK